MTIAKRGKITNESIWSSTQAVPRSSISSSTWRARQLLAKGLCERIGIDGHLKHTPLVGDKPVFNEDIPLPSHAEAIAAVIDKLTSAEYRRDRRHERDRRRRPPCRPRRRGSLPASVLITDEVHRRPLRTVPPAPRCTTPPTSPAINAVRRASIGQGRAPGRRVRHRLPPDHARQGLYVRPALRVLSASTASAAMASTAPATAMSSQRCARAHGQARSRELKLITCHLGNGSSICAIKNGKSVDTTMGFTPLVGLPMGTRAGGVDPRRSAVPHEQGRHGHPTTMLNVLNKKSGVLGISGVSQRLP